MNEYILLTGGNGFIGSHIAIELLELNKNIIIIDDLSNSDKKNIDKIKKITNKDFIFFNNNVSDIKILDDIFNKFKINCVIHLAGYKSVSDSIKNPLNYYKNNLYSTLNLIEIMQKYNCYNLIFSSSATVYGNNPPPLKENSIIGSNLLNPYARTKYFIEEILKDLVISNNKWTIISLRYFNPVGAHESGLIGDDPSKPANLMPIVVNVGIKNNINKNVNLPNELNILGNDYNTYDGTCLRDFIHVVDLAKGHIKAIEKINELDKYNIFNLGTGNGISVLELVNTFIKINKVNIPFKFSGRRDGDLAISYCIPDKSLDILGWKCEKNLEQMCNDSWNYAIKNYK